MMNSPIFLGVNGWNRPDWAQTFYPQDMPEEWRLTYYNTQFACVYLAEADWRCVDAASWRQWAEDTHEDFRFLLENAAPTELPAVLGERALGVTEAEVLWFDRSTTLRDLADRIKTTPRPRWLISRDGDNGQIAQVETLLDLLGF